jgi:voltage-gated potassium channel
VLFYSLLFTIVADPVFTALGWGDGLIELFLAANLLAAVTSIDLGIRRPALFAVLAAIVLGRVAAPWIALPSWSVTMMAVWTMAGLIAAGGALRFALTARVVGLEHVYAALSAYLLAGLFFGLAYWSLDQISPGSLSGASTHSLDDAIYFSFVTLATLGYGDIVPRGEIARGLAVVEGIGGQLFLAVMVARLVSLYVRKD